MLLMTACGGLRVLPSDSGNGNSADTTATATEGSSALRDMIAADLDENEVKLGDVFSANKVTLINYWGTFCGPCISEMPDLAKVAHKYSDRGFGIIGLTCDIADPSTGAFDRGNIKAAKDIAEATGADYPILIATKQINGSIQTNVVPISFFVDENGDQIGGVITGSRPYEEWDRIISEVLSDAGQP